MVEDHRIWGTPIVITIHHTHRMVTDPNHLKHKECAGCGTGTRTGLPELEFPCSYVLDYMTPRPEGAPPDRWDNVYAWVEPSQWFDDSMRFAVAYRHPNFGLVTANCFKEIGELERYPDLFGKIFEALIKMIDDDIVRLQAKPVSLGRGGRQ